VSEFPALEASLLRAARRRYGWRRWRPRVAVAVAAAALAGVVLLVARPAAPADVERPAAPAWKTVPVPRYGATVSLPEGWSLARASLTPHLLDPHEILTAITPSVTPVQRNCAQFPAVALGPDAALVTIQERAGATAFAPRPARFRDTPVSPITARMVQACVGGPGAVSYQSFSDGTRNFNALVVIAPSATSRVRGEAYAILDRLRFDQSFVPWWPAAGR
jgi:hypothetical protein